MSLSNQKLALVGFAAAAACATLGRWGLGTSPIRERDVAIVFAGGLLAGLSLVRFFRQMHAPPDVKPPAADAAPPPPTPPTPPRTKS